MALARAVLPATLVALLASAPAAYGHAAFLGSTPGPGQRVEAPPGQVRLHFTEPLIRRLTTVDLRRGETRVPASVAISARQVILTPARPLADGPYRVRWRTVSTEDGHRLEGTFSFGLRAPALSATAAVEDSPWSSGAWVRIPFRVLLYASLLLLAGALILRALLPDRSGRPWLAPPELEQTIGSAQVATATERHRTLLGDISALALGGAAGSAAVDAFQASDRISVDALADYLLAGSAGIARLLTIVLVAGAAWQAARRPRTAAALATAALGTVAMSGHANSADPRIAALINDWVHLGAAATWLGGIALVLFSWRAGLRDRVVRMAVARQVLPVFGRVALPAFALLVVSGSVSALIELGRVAALWDTAYGRILGAKIMIVGLIALLSYIHALRLRPRLLAKHDLGIERRHWRLLRAEPPLAAAVIIAAGALVTFPLPPRQAGALAQAAPATPCDPCPLRAPAGGELAVAAQAGRGVVAAWIRRGRGELRGELLLRDLAGRPSDAPLRVLGGRLTPCGRGCLKFSAPARRSLVVERHDQGRWNRVRLPAQWLAGRSAGARELLERTQDTMRALRWVREVERVTSGPGTLAVTTYDLAAPDRLSAMSSSGVRRLEIGARGWLRPGPRQPWRRSAPGVPFRVRTWFRWTPFAQAIELLQVRRENGRRVAELAFFDPGSPSWQRLTVDLVTGRALGGEIVTRAHHITQRFSRFNRPVQIRAPRS